MGVIIVSSVGSTAAFKLLPLAEANQNVVVVVVGGGGGGGIIIP
jgi:hypothetical protein